MFHTLTAITTSPPRPAHLVRLAGIPLVAAIAIAGCGSSSTHASSTTTQKHMSMTHTTAMHHTSMASGGPMTHMMMSAAAHAELTVGSSHYGHVLYDNHHLVLYAFSADHATTSTCYGACSHAWPPMLTKGTPRVAGLNRALLGTTRRSDGSLQVTYAGHPLYFWSGDTEKTIKCQHVNLHGGYWYVVDPNGQVNHAKGIDTMTAMG